MIALWTWLGINVLFGVYALIVAHLKSDWFYFTVYPILWMPLSRRKVNGFWMNALTWLFTIVFLPFLLVYWLVIVCWLLAAIVLTIICDLFSKETEDECEETEWPNI